MKQFVLRYRFVMAAATSAAALAAVALAEPSAPHDPTDDYGEFFARPEELAGASVNRIARSLRLNRQAMVLGRKVYDEHCASCHGDDLKGILDREREVFPFVVSVQLTQQAHHLAVLAAMVPSVTQEYLGLLKRICSRAFRRSKAAAPAARTGNRVVVDGLAAKQTLLHVVNGTFGCVVQDRVEA